METPSPSDTPQLVITQKGVSVFYKNKYLYSRYAPEVAAEQLCAQLSFLPKTLIFCFSPLLFYGVKTLFSRLHKQCTVVFIETDPALYEFSQSAFSGMFEQKPQAAYELITSTEQLAALLARAENPQNSFYVGNYQRCQFINLSGGAFLHEQKYLSIKKIADDWLSRFWKNRITLIKMGKLYARNLLQNLAQIPNSRILPKKTEHRPIIVFGAGPSTDIVLNTILQTDWQSYRRSFCLISVDSALVPLLQRGIIPDAVIALESQLANEKAFIGVDGSQVFLVSDLTGRPAIPRITGGKTAFICSHYAKTIFLARVKQLLPECVFFEPLGSVGLAALETALLLRASQDIPVFFAGLDFCYLPGKTHCRAAPAHTNALNTHTRLQTLENPEPAYRQGAFVIQLLNGIPAVCEPALEGYGKLFSARYSNQINVFTLSDFGAATGFSFFSPQKLITLYNKKSNPSVQSSNQALLKEKRFDTNEESNKILIFLKAEQAALERIKELLLSRSNDDVALDLIKEREYLFLHFADGHLPPKNDASFFNRIRGELGVFLKDINLSIRRLESALQT